MSMGDVFMSENPKVFLLVLGSGDDGDERSVDGVYSSREKAEEVAKTYPDWPEGMRVEVEEWPVE
jgi:hypothetical protein